ncbi:MAG: hypothetical protein A2428_07615 [Bdellovibrionales bacterium RIFOXYC1_FULL_54_43]|nr:MAG: hypothetical protein A2428_07615 [Bdellovibrionales bacterium RIFOXYC1_FULL_54_43]OFZ84592.1 MAG: hypothetical protein A2603_11950 [Bdellovibrionales bacterium RIFOXYD1_FULL_55_31]
MSFENDPLFCRLDQVAKQKFDFADDGAPRRVIRNGSADVDLVPLRGAEVCCSAGKRNGRNGFPSSLDVPVDVDTSFSGHLNGHVVIRSVVFGFPVERSAWIIVEVVRGIPPFIAKVDSATKGDDPVDNTDFLMMRATEGVAIVEDEMNPWVNLVPDSALPEFPFDNVKIRVVPYQEIHVKIRFGFT